MAKIIAFDEEARRGLERGLNTLADAVKVSREAVADGVLKAVLFNSGNANACNGAQGDQDARATSAARSPESPRQVNACS